MTQQAQPTHTLFHTHCYGSTTYHFAGPEGFDVPTGIFNDAEGDGLDDPALMAVLTFLNISYEPEAMEEVIVESIDLVEQPSLEELQRLMPAVAA